MIGMSLQYGSFFVLAGLLALAGGITALDVSVDSSSVTGLEVAASADATAEASVQADAVSPTPEVSPVLPIKARVKEALDKRAEARENAKERLEEARENAKQRLEKARQNAKERIEDARKQAQERVRDTRENAREKMEQLREKSRDAVQAAREREAELALKIKSLKAKANLNGSERAELADASKLHVKAAFEQRIALAQKMEAEGANASLVADFVAYAQAARDQFANASNHSARKDIVVAFNQRWRVFKQAVARDLLKAKLVQSVNASRQVLARLDAVIARLTAAGFNTTALMNASAAVSARLDTVLAEPDVPHALARLRQVQAGLVHLRNAIQRTVNKELVEAYREVPMPTVASDASLSITGSIDASGSSAASASPSTPPTIGSGEAAGSPEPAVA